MIPKKKSALGFYNAWISIIANLVVLGTFIFNSMKDNRMDRLDIITIVVLIIYSFYNTYMIINVLNLSKDVTGLYQNLSDTKFHLEINILVHFYILQYNYRVRVSGDNETMEDFVTRHIVASAHDVNVLKLREEIKKFFPKRE